VSRHTGPRARVSTPALMPTNKTRAFWDSRSKPPTTGHLRPNRRIIGGCHVCHGLRRRGDARGPSIADARMRFEQETRATVCVLHACGRQVRIFWHAACSTPVALCSPIPKLPTLHPTKPYYGPGTGSSGTPHAPRPGTWHTGKTRCTWRSNAWFAAHALSVSHVHEQTDEGINAPHLTFCCGFKAL
jgi:hypothetical protein